MARWVELFYDLAFVGAILILSAAASHIEPQWNVVYIVLVFAASWWIWFSTTILANRYHMADLLHRVLLLLQMLVIVLMAMESRASLQQDATALAVEYGVLLASIALIAYRASLREPSNKRHAERLVMVNGIAAVGFFVAAALPQDWRVAICVAALALAVVPSVAWLHQFDVVTAVDERHLVERMGAFTLIVFGEAFIEVATTVSGSTIPSIDVLSLVFEFVLVLALFTSYFEDIPTAGLHPRRLGAWAGCHLVAQICIAATAIAASKLVDYQTSLSLPDSEVFRLTLPLAVLYLAFAGIGACGRREPSTPLVWARVGTAVVILVFDLFVWQVAPVHLTEGLPVITLIAVAHAAVVVRLRNATRVPPSPFGKAERPAT
jgi:low temperature requirement protein LtrA